MPGTLLKSLKTEQQLFAGLTLYKRFFPFKGGDPAAGSPTATLLRLHPNYQSYLGRLLPKG